MHTLCIAITDELNRVLRSMAQESETDVGPLIESLLRGIPTVRLKKTELGIEWKERPIRGSGRRKESATYDKSRR